MPNLVVYVPKQLWSRLEQELGAEFPAWARKLTVKHMQEFIDGLSGRDETVTRPIPDARVSANDSRSENPEVKRSYEPFSLVCKNRANHKPGVYCPECKGDGGR